MKPLSRKLLFAAGIAAVAFVGFFITTRLFGTICFFKAMTGIPCPGCGMTRALFAAARGQFKRAFYFHPLFPAAPVFVAGVGAYSFSKKPNVRKAAAVLLFIICAEFVLVWIFRLAGGWR